MVGYKNVSSVGDRVGNFSLLHEIFFRPGTENKNDRSQRVLPVEHIEKLSHLFVLNQEGWNGPDIILQRTASNEIIQQIVPLKAHCRGADRVIKTIKKKRI